MRQFCVRQSDEVVKGYRVNGRTDTPIDSTMYLLFEYTKREQMSLLILARLQYSRSTHFILSRGSQRDAFYITRKLSKEFGLD